MRLRIVRRPTESRIDGIRLDHFRVGDQYEVGTALGGVFLAEGWAVPVPDDVPALARGVEYQAPTTPPNLIREADPPYYSERFRSRPAVDRPPADERRRRRRRESDEHRTPPTDGF
jgi:hypothetical protein